MSSIAETPASPAGDASPDAIKAQLAGTWKLVSAFDYDDKTKTWQPSFGEPPSGYFIYAASGYASVQIMVVPPVKIADPKKGPTPEEAQQIVNNYIAYYGPWTADASFITVIPEGNLDSTQLGPENPQKRPYELKDANTLIIGDQTTYIRTLQRVL